MVWNMLILRIGSQLPCCNRFVFIAYNGWWLGEVPSCRMFNYSTKACGGILPNHCYKPFLLVFGVTI
jgi:hypothetical protein